MFITLLLERSMNPGTVPAFVESNGVLRAMLEPTCRCRSTTQGVPQRHARFAKLIAYEQNSMPAHLLDHLCATLSRGKRMVESEKERWPKARQPKWDESLLRWKW